MLFSFSRARQYTNKIWVKERMPTIVKVFAGHHLPAATFNSIKFTKATDDIDGTASVCVIQTSKVVETGYLLGSRKTMVNSYWDKLYNNHPKFNKLDIKVSSHSIQDLTSGPWNPMNNVHSAHILCSIEDEKGINKKMCSLYNKNHKQSRAANDLPKGFSFFYISLNQTN